MNLAVEPLQEHRLRAAVKELDMIFDLLLKRSAGSLAGVCKQVGSECGLDRSFLVRVLVASLAK